jgi:hypothetical protein
MDYLYVAQENQFFRMKVDRQTSPLKINRSSRNKHAASLEKYEDSAP